MRNETTVSQWGNSLAIRIPLAIARQDKLREGDCLALGLASDGRIFLRPTRKEYELAELVARITKTIVIPKPTGAGRRARKPGEGRLCTGGR
jgi:antitoxin MazE